MKSIQWKIVINDDDQIASLETVNGFKPNSIETHLIIIGLLENLKSKHQEHLKTLYNKTVKQSGGLTIEKNEKNMDEEEDADLAL